MEDAYKDVGRSAVVAPTELSSFDGVAPDDTAALTRSLAQRMQETYPFAPSPVAQVYARPPAPTTTGLLRLDAIMNATEPGLEETPHSNSDTGSLAGFRHSYDNENRSLNSCNIEMISQQHVAVESGKSSISFILGDDGRQSTQRCGSREGHNERHLDDDGDWCDASSDASLDLPDLEPHPINASPSSAAGHQGRAPVARRLSASSTSSASSSGRGQIKKSRICKFDGCTRYVVNRGLCIGHGGGKRCAVTGCTSSAKNLGVCWKHGGSTKCTVNGCDNRAKSRGVCWSHGGGKNCSGDGCTKTAVSHGLCWAHGGGKRCVMEGCKKPAYERNGNLCSVHQHSTGAVA